MRTLTILTTTAMILTLPAAAMADRDRSIGRGHAEPVAVSAVQQKVDALGYDLRGLRADHHGFKARIVDRATGAAVKARFDAAGELLRAALAD